MSKRDNKGYTLVEMVIVIAIVAILAAMATVSVTLIHSAKAKEAAISFDNDVAALVTRSKNMQISDSDIAAGFKYHAMHIYKDANGYYYIEKVLWAGPATNTYKFDYTAISKISDEHALDDGKLTFDEMNDNEKAQLYTSLSKHVDIKLDGADLPSTGVFLAYNKAGLCVYGNGEYQFLKDNGNQVAKVEVRKNGSHQSR